MKKIILALSMILIFASGIFAASQDSLTLNYFEPSTQDLILYYDNELVSRSNENEGFVELTTGQSKAFTLKWKGNVGINTNEIAGITLRAENGFVNTAAKDSVAVWFDAGMAGWNQDVKDGNGNNVGKLVVGADADYVFISFNPIPFTKDELIISTFYAMWDGTHPWVAGDYECNITIEYYGC